MSFSQKLRSQTGTLLWLLCVILVGTLPGVGCQKKILSAERSTTVNRVPDLPSPQQSVPHSATIGFRTTRHLEEHYQKHGSEFGQLTQAEYLRRAQELRDAPVRGEILEARRDDGVETRFDRATGAFLAFDADLTIRTFFKPNDGERYFKRQISRNH